MTKKIVLFCAGGFSTSLLVNKMKEAAATKGKDYNIAAYSISAFDKVALDADAILIGPQVRYVVQKLQTEHPELHIIDIPMKMYGTMDGKGAVELAEKLMGED
jgi:PTS system cellobiose-specific IIB component